MLLHTNCTLTRVICVGINCTIVSSVYPKEITFLTNELLTGINDNKQQHNVPTRLDRQRGLGDGVVFFARREIKQYQQRNKIKGKQIPFSAPTNE